MSLQHAAKHLEKHGRNGDTMLVHMSKGEVKSLNDLAMAGGGHLTINPHTGLPEAGFLSRMLPMAIGAGLMMVPGMQPMAAAALVGGGYAASTGSLKKGLMAGLGAYGGAGMAGSFGAAGASSVAPEVAATPAPVVDATPVPVTQPPVPTATPVPVTQPPVPVEVPTATSAPVNSPSASGTPLVGVNGPTPGSYNYLPPPPVSVAEPVALEPPAPAPVDPVASYKSAFGDTSVNASNFQRAYNQVQPSVETSQFAQGAGGDEINAKFGAQTPSMDFNNMTASQRLEAVKSGASFDNLKNWAGDNKYTAYGMGASALMPWDEDPPEKKKPDSDPGQQYTYEANATNPTPSANPYGQEQKYFNQRYVKRAAGGITGNGNLDLHIPLDLGGGGGGGLGSAATYPFQNNGGFAGNNNAPQASQQARDQFNAEQAQRMQPYQTSPPLGLGAPQGNLFSGVEAEPQDLSSMKGTTFGDNSQQGMSQLMGLLGGQKMASGGMATGGISDAQYNLGGYSDGGRLLRGPGDGVSDSIPAVIGKKQPARLADGEFVVPARIVSEIGNGSTEAGARKLYAMMDRIQKARGKTVGKGKVAKNTRADKYLPA